MLDWPAAPSLIPDWRQVDVITCCIRIVRRRPYEKWNYQTWRAAIQELHKRSDDHLIVRLDGVVALQSKRLGQVYRTVNKSARYAEEDNY